MNNHETKAQAENNDVTRLFDHYFKLLSVLMLMLMHLFFVFYRLTFYSRKSRTRLLKNTN